jgi:hypothetical protein
MPDDGDFDDDFDGDFDDDDDDRYVEFILVREPGAEPVRDAPNAPVYEEMDTGPLRFAEPRAAPAEALQSEPFDSWRSLLDESVPPNGSIGFAHNGFHVEVEERFSSIAEYFSTNSFRSGPPDDRLAPRGQHYRPDPDDDPAGHGRHSSGK